MYTVEEIRALMQAVSEQASALYDSCSDLSRALDVVMPEGSALLTLPPAAAAHELCLLCVLGIAH